MSPYHRLMLRQMASASDRTHYVAGNGSDLERELQPLILAGLVRVVWWRGMTGFRITAEGEQAIKE